MLDRTLFLVLFLVLAAPAAAGSLEPGTVVADGDGTGLVILLHVQGGYGDAQSVYVVRPVAHCADPAGQGWYALPSIHEIRSAPELEARPRQGMVDPGTLTSTCIAPVDTPDTTRQRSSWDRFLDGTLFPFPELTFPPFDPDR